MLLMTEDERIETLIESVQASGVAFKDMDRFTQKAIMAAAGITDLNEANKIFGMSAAAYRENQRELAKSTKIQERFEDAVQKTVPVLEQFKLMAAEFIVSIQPFLNKLTEGAKFLTETLRDMSPEQKEMIANIVMAIGAAASLAVVFKSLAFIFGPLGSGIVLAAKGFMAMGAAAGGALTPLTVIGPTSVGAAGGLMALVKVFGLLALAIGGVTLAMSVYQKAKQGSVEAQSKIAEASAREAEAYERASSSLAGLASVDFDTVNLKVQDLVQSIASIGDPSNIMVKSRATIENLALISTGQAKDSMTGNIIQASATNFTANVENIFSGMKMVVQVGKTEFEGVVKDIVEPMIENTVTG